MTTVFGKRGAAQVDDGIGTNAAFFTTITAMTIDTQTKRLYVVAQGTAVRVVLLDTGMLCLIMSMSVWVSVI